MERPGALLTLAGLALIGACFTAMLVPTLLRDKPIYDSLREHVLRSTRPSPD